MRRGVEREGGASGCPDGVRFPVSAWFWSSGGNGRREPPAWPSCGRPSWHDSGRGSLERAFPGDARPAARPPRASAPSPGSRDPCRGQCTGSALGISGPRRFDRIARFAGGGAVNLLVHARRRAGICPSPIERRPGKRSGAAKGGRTDALKAAAVRGRSPSGYSGTTALESTRRNFLFCKRCVSCYDDNG